MSKDRLMGGSYGGYRCSRRSHSAEEFAVGVDIFGVQTGAHFTVDPPYWESFRKSLYKEIGDPSPARQLKAALRSSRDKIRRPLIVLQGANDPALSSRIRRIVEAAKKSGVPVEYVVSTTRATASPRKRRDSPNKRFLSSSTSTCAERRGK